MKIYPLPTLFTESTTVVLANGAFPVHKIPLTILENSNYIVCCDGAVNKLALTDIAPTAIVGDCDSLSDENKEKYRDIIYTIHEQDTNDLTKSVKFCIEHGKRNIVILGATGNREDHTIANISLLADYIDFMDNICMITDYGIFNAVNSLSTFESYPGQQVSLFCIIPGKVTTYKLKYPVKNRVFTNWWQATLNESESNTFTVETNSKTIVFRAF